MVQIGTYRSRQFANTLMMLLQQQGSRLRGKVTEKGYTGKMASPVDQVGAVEMQPVTGRFTPMGRVDAPADRRWVSPSFFDLPQLVAETDTVEMILDPKGKYMENALAAAGRQVDRTILAAALATNYTGEEGTTATTFLAGNIVAKNFGASASVGMTVAKLREIRRIFGTHNLDFQKEKLRIAMTITQHDNLLGEVQTTNADYNGGNAVLVDGMIKRFLGFDFEILELVNYAESTVRACVAWAESGMHLGLWTDIKTNISLRNDLTGIPTQLYVKMGIGATRLEEKKLVQVNCQE